MKLPRKSPQGARLLPIFAVLVTMLGLGALIGTGTANAASGWRAHQLSANGFQYCMDADLNTWYNNGGKVQGWSCNGQQNQQWWANYPTSPGETTLTTIRTPGSPVGPAKCLDDDLNNLDHVQLWDCNGWQNQGWYITLSCDNAGCFYDIMSQKVVGESRYLVPGANNGDTVVAIWWPGGGYDWWYNLP